MNHYDLPCSMLHSFALCIATYCFHHFSLSNDASYLWPLVHTHTGEFTIDVPEPSASCGGASHPAPRGIAPTSTPPPPLFPFHNAPATAQPDAISSSRAGPRAPSELDAARRAAGATPHRPEHHRAIAAPLPGPPFGELPRQCLPILRSVCATASNPTLVLRNPTRAFPDLHASRRRRETPNRR
jgi:hypothetical protein